MLTSLKGSWTVVLGASRERGRAIALAVAAEGGNVAGVHLDTAAADDAVADLLAELRGHGGEAHLFNANAANPRTRAELVGQIADLTGPDGVRMFVHSLAFGSLGPYLPGGDLPAVTGKQLDMTLNVMANSLVYWAQDLHAARLLRPGAKVFALTSAGGVR